MKTSLIALSLSSFFLLPGCLWTRWNPPTVPVNLNYAQSSYGYLNSGGFKSGSLFRWKQGATEQDPGALFFVANLDGFDRPERTDLTDKDFAFYQSGAEVDLGGNIDLKEIDIKTEIAKRARFEISNFQRYKTDLYLTQMSDHIKIHPASETDPERLRTQAEKDEILKTWRFREAARESDHYYILVTDVTYGDSVQLEIDKEIEAGAQFLVPIVGGGKVRIDLIGKDLRELSGEFTGLMFSIDVIAPSWKTNDEGGQNPDFHVVTGDVFPDMPNLLRNLGKKPVS